MSVSSESLAEDTAAIRSIGSIVFRCLRRVSRRGRSGNQVVNFATKQVYERIQPLYIFDNKGVMKWLYRKNANRGRNAHVPAMLKNTNIYRM